MISKCDVLECDKLAAKTVKIGAWQMTICSDCHKKHAVEVLDYLEAQQKSNSDLARKIILGGE